jgi:hypothetical protein
MKRKEEQAIMADNATYARAMADQARMQHKNLQNFLGNHYDN